MDVINFFTTLLDRMNPIIYSFIVSYLFFSTRKIRALKEQLAEATNSNNDDDNSFDPCTIEIYSANGTLIKTLDGDFKFENFDNHSISVMDKNNTCYDIVTTTGTIVVKS